VSVLSGGDLIDGDVVGLFVLGHICARREDIARTVTAHFPAAFVVKAAKIAEVVLQ